MAGEGDAARPDRLQRLVDRVGAAKLIFGTLLALLASVAATSWTAANLYRDFQDQGREVQRISERQDALAREVSELRSELSDLDARAVRVELVARQAWCESRGFVFDLANLTCLAVPSHP